MFAEIFNRVFSPKLKAKRAPDVAVVAEAPEIQPVLEK